MRKLLFAAALFFAGTTSLASAQPIPVLVDHVWTIDGEPMSSPSIRMAVERRLRQAGFRPVRNADRSRAELVVEVAARRNTEMMGIFSSFSELAVQLYDSDSGQLLYQQAFDRERGLQLSYEEAGRLSVEHALSRFVEKLLPDMARVAEAFYDTGSAESVGDNPDPGNTDASNSAISDGSRTDSVAEPASGTGSNPAEIVILEPAQTRGIRVARSRTPRITVRGRVLDDAPVSGLTVNTRPVPVVDGEFSVDLALDPGSKIVVVVVDSDGNRTEKSLSVPMEQLQPPRQGRFVALVVGIDLYSGVWTPLDNAARDAQSVGTLLKDEYGFDDVTILLNDHATRVDILRAFEEMIATVGQHDNVLIYYAGHGDYQERMRRGFWVPFDAASRSIIDFIPNSVIRDLVRGIPSRHTLLIADACFAGEVFRGDEAEGNAEPDADLRWQPSRKALTSGGVEPVMDGGEDGHSLFAYRLLETLRNAEDAVTAAELFEALRDPIVARTNQTPLYSAIGDSGDEGGQFVFQRKR